MAIGFDALFLRAGSIHAAARAKRYAGRGVGAAAPRLLLAPAAQRSDTGRTMSRENVEVVRRCHEGVTSRDWDAVMKAYAADTVWDDRDLRPEGDVNRGIEAMRAEMPAWSATWTD